MKSGYDVPPLGVSNGQFYAIHVTALLSICASLVCAISVLIYSFNHNKSKHFVLWNKSERLIVYLAGGDTAFNVIHSSEHLQMLITKEHAHPRAFCEFHSFMTLTLCISQVFIVLFVATNIFCLMFLHKDIFLGKRDWKLLVPITTIPILIGIVSVASGKVGPSGAFCLFDSVTAPKVNIYVTTLPVCLVLVSNAILYGLTWYRIKTDVKRLAKSLGIGATASTRRAHRAAKNMVLFLIAFFVQWWVVAMYGAWCLFAPAPVFIFITNMVFSNTGGVWNGIVYLVIHRRRQTTLPKQTTVDKMADRKHETSNKSTQETHIAYM